MEANKQFHLTYIPSKRPFSIVFKLNSDDYNNFLIKKITKYLKDNGFSFKKSRTYSKVKLMSWVKFEVDSETYVSFEENDILANSILNKAIF